MPKSPGRTLEVSPIDFFERALELSELDVSEPILRSEERPPPLVRIPATRRRLPSC